MDLSSKSQRGFTGCTTLSAVSRIAMVAAAVMPTDLSEAIGESPLLRCADFRL